MKKYLILVMLMITVFGCDKEFLERAPLDKIPSDLVFEDKGLLEAYLYRTYSYLPQGFGDVSKGYGFRYVLGSITDESRAKSGWIRSNRIIAPGLMSATNGNDNGLDNWANLYQGIRRANNIIGSLETSSLDDDYKTRIASEARYIRAWLYFDLTRRYGNVPLIKKSQTLDDDLLVSQTPRAEVYNFVDEELDAIAANIPLKEDITSAEVGRINRETVWSLSSRVNLFAENYAKAAASANSVINSPSGFVLNPNLDELFQSDGGDAEVIFEILNVVPFKGHNFDALNLPFSYRTVWSSQTDPTQELVDAFEMAATGLPITDIASGYDANNPYDGRDKRFYSTVIYNGAMLKGRAVDTSFPNGADRTALTGLHTITGYYIKKFIDESIPAGPDLGESDTSWKEFRLGEILLNYAEAQNEASGPDSGVYDAINRVRTRAGLPDLPAGLSKEAMRDRIIHERRVELAFENHRWFDLIRWGKSEEVLNDKVFTGINVTEAGAGAFTYATFSITNRPKQVFLPKHYLMPIPQSEIDKNPNLVQNPGY